MCAGLAPEHTRCARTHAHIRTYVLLCREPPTAASVCPQFVLAHVRPKVIDRQTDGSDVRVRTCNLRRGAAAGAAAIITTTTTTNASVVNELINYSFLHRPSAVHLRVPTGIQPARVRKLHHQPHLRNAENSRKITSSSFSAQSDSFSSARLTLNQAHTDTHAPTTGKGLRGQSNRTTGVRRTCWTFLGKFQEEEERQNSRTIEQSSSGRNFLELTEMLDLRRSCFCALWLCLLLLVNLSAIASSQRHALVNSLQTSARQAFWRSISPSNNAKEPGFFHNPQGAARIHATDSELRPDM
ncbi:unnamed protein product [Schistocephalus solidus]|uniref:Secreted protein n=1 Tax=Schistocephalus solidus TaxID=70667 RepID=A0A183TUD3_SCHSO|nr:unnamed protein product [Schistocephalus solidus]